MEDECQGAGTLISRTLANVGCNGIDAFEADFNVCQLFLPVDEAEGYQQGLLSPLGAEDRGVGLFRKVPYMCGFLLVW